MADAGAGWAMIAAQALAVAATVTGVGLKLGEAVAEYNRQEANLGTRISETTAEGARQISTAKAEGILSLEEQGRQNAFEAQTVTRQAEQLASSQENKLGVSGVRATGSPLLAAQQEVDVAFGAAENKIQAGNAAMRIGGLRLQNTFGDIGARTSLLTAELGREQSDLARRRAELQTNMPLYLSIAALGGAASLASSFYTLGSNQGWWK